MITKREQIDSASYHFLKHFAYHTEIVRPGSCANKTEYVDGLAQALTAEECTFVAEAAAASREPEAVSNELLERYRPKEATVRDHFVSYLRREHITNPDEEAIFFEFPIAGRRADINRVNGKSHTYELKSPRDDDSRLAAQLKAYLQVFDYVTVVVPADDELVNTKLPSVVGLVTYEYPSFEFEIEHSPIQATTHAPREQLKRLRKDELREVLEPTPSHNTRKRAMVDRAIEELDSPTIDDLFKRMLKRRYREA